MKNRKTVSKITLPDVIPQAWLNRYQDLQKVAGELSALKNTLRAALENGASVEPGPLTARLDIRQCHRLSQKFLFEKLGISAEAVKKLKQTSPLSNRTYLVVSESQEPDFFDVPADDGFAWLDAAIDDPNSPIHDHCDR